MGSFPQTYNDPSLSSRFLGNCPPTPPLCQCVICFSEIQKLTFSGVNLANSMIEQSSLDKDPR